MSKEKRKPKTEIELKQNRDIKARVKVNRIEKEKHNKLDTLVLYLAALVAGLVPIIVYGKIKKYIMPVMDDYLNLSTGSVTDFFTYYKSMALIILACLILAVYIYKVFSHKQDIKVPIKNCIPIFVFMISLCLSLLLSNYKTFALWGGYTRSFGVIAYISCAIIFFVLINQEINNKWVKLIMFSLYPLVLINAFMIIVSFYGINLWDYAFFKSMVGGEAQRYIKDGFRINGTLSHINYISGMGSVIFAIFSGKAVFYERKFSKEGIVDIIMAALGAMIVYASKSLSGMVTLVLVCTLMIGLILTNKKTVAIHFAIIIALSAFGWCILSLHDPLVIADLINSAGLLLSTAGIGLLIFAVYFVLENEERLKQHIDKKKAIIIGSGVLVACLAIIIFIEPVAEKKITTEMNRISTEKIMQKLEKNEFGFPQAKFTWGTGRIYLWKETLGLVAQKPLFGYGFDTLPFIFNQADPAKIAALNSATVVVDKPHNTYINMLYGAGIVTFLAYAAIIVMVIRKSLKTILSGEDFNVFLWPLLLGIIAYLYQGLFNDPVQGFEPTFWILLALSYALAGTKNSDVLDEKV